MVAESFWPNAVPRNRVQWSTPGYQLKWQRFWTEVSLWQDTPEHTAGMTTSSEALWRLWFNYFFHVSPYKSSGWGDYCHIYSWNPLYLKALLGRKLLFWVFHCRLFIMTFQKGGMKTGKTTQRLQWPRWRASTLGQAMKVAVSPLSRSRSRHKGYVPHVKP